jgi:vacuolar-type H+-ATPase subunit C/Vma6
MIGANDADHLAARLHGRRSRMAEGERLRALCALGSPRELGQALFPGEGAGSALAVQAKVAGGLAAELAGLAAGMGGARAAFLFWLAARFQAENLKVAVRAVVSGAAGEEAAGLFLDLPAALNGYGHSLLSSKTLSELAAALPAGPLRAGLARALELHGGSGTPFFYEAEIDRAYFAELLARASAVPGPGRAPAETLARQELGMFLAALAARARAYYGLDKKALLGLYLEGSPLSRRKFSALLDAPAQAAPEPGEAEAATWALYARLANRAFRRAGADFGAPAGYAALRRVEAANLYTVSEGLRLGVPPAELRARLLGAGEAADV